MYCFKKVNYLVGHPIGFAISNPWDAVDKALNIIGPHCAHCLVLTKLNSSWLWNLSDLRNGKMVISGNIDFRVSSIVITQYVGYLKYSYNKIEESESVWLFAGASTYQWCQMWHKYLWCQQLQNNFIYTLFPTCLLGLKIRFMLFSLA